MITIVNKKITPQKVTGLNTKPGCAYRLVHNSIGANDIYIGSHNWMFNMNTYEVRPLRNDEFYVEVDLEIIVKEKN